MSLFQGIEQFRGQLDAINIQLVFRMDGQIGVTVTPVVPEKVAASNPELARPFGLAGAAADMDRDFADAMKPLATTRASLVDQANAAAAALKAIKKPTSAPKAAPQPTKASGSVTFEADPDPEGDGDDASPERASSGGSDAKPVGAVAPTSAADLFDAE